jgi:hypothetical protein
MSTTTRSCGCFANWDSANSFRGRNMAEYKSISGEAIPLALEKAQRYRLLNEPVHAESISRDILAIDPNHQEALVILLLALTDQFASECPHCFDEAQAVVPRLHGEYQQLYYSGIIWERRGHARAVEGTPAGKEFAYAWIRQAMDLFERAERVRPHANDDSILRWNSCVRLCERYQLKPEAQERDEPTLDD